MMCCSNFVAAEVGRRLEGPINRELRALHLDYIPTKERNVTLEKQNWKNIKK